MGAASHKFKPAAYKIAVAAYNINLQNIKSDYNTKKREHSFSILKNVFIIACLILLGTKLSHMFSVYISFYVR